MVARHNLHKNGVKNPTEGLDSDNVRLSTAAELQTDYNSSADTVMQWPVHVTSVLAGSHPVHCNPPPPPKKKKTTDLIV